MRGNDVMQLAKISDVGGGRTRSTKKINVSPHKFNSSGTKEKQIEK